LDLLEVLVSAVIVASSFATATIAASSFSIATVASSSVAVIASSSSAITAASLFAIKPKDPLQLFKLFVVVFTQLTI